MTQTDSFKFNLDVIIPFHNLNPYLIEAVNSVKSSSGVNTRIIAVNDTGTEIHPKQIGLEDNDVLINCIGKGYQDALSTGVEISTAEYLGFQDSDDFTDRERFYNQIELLNRNGFDAVTCRLVRTNAFGKSFPKFPIFGELPGNLSQAQRLIFGPHGADSTIVGKTTFIKQNWFYHKSFTVSFADYGWLLSTVSDGKFGFAENALYYYRSHDDQMSRRAKDLPGWSKLFILWQSNLERVVRTQSDEGSELFTSLLNQPLVGLALAFPSALPKLNKIERGVFKSLIKHIFISLVVDDQEQKKNLKETLYRRGFVGTRGRSPIFWVSGFRMCHDLIMSWIKGIKPRLMN
jgi:glycosyltransferase involved in cell wall biosynthesis